MGYIDGFINYKDGAIYRSPKLNIFSNERLNNDARCYDLGGSDRTLHLLYNNHPLSFPTWLLKVPLIKNTYILLY